MDNIYLGRRRIFTSCLPKALQPDDYIGDTLDRDTIAYELTKALAIHNENAKEFEWLEKFYLGKHPIMDRPQEDRQVNNKVIINHAQAITRDFVGYTYSAGIQFTPRVAERTEDIKIITDFLKAENWETHISSLAYDQSIGGVAYLGMTYDKSMQNGAPFNLIKLNPVNTAVVYAAHNSTLPVFAWTSHPVKKKDIHGNETTTWIYDVYTAYEKYRFESMSNTSVRPEDLKSIAEHIYKAIPIIEFPNNEFRMGDWESAISLMNAINSLASDSINDVEQTVTSYLAIFGAEVEDESDWQKIQRNRLLVFPGQTGVNQDAKFITAQLDGSSAQLLRSYLEQSLKFVVGIPDRDTGTAGSDTGISAEVRTGSGDIEIVAKNKVQYAKMGARRLLKILLWILSPQYISNKIKIFDVDVDIPRNKRDNLLTKTQAGVNLYRMDFPLQDIVAMMDVTSDITGLASRWEAEREAKAEADKLALQNESDNLYPIDEKTEADIE